MNLVWVEMFIYLRGHELVVLYKDMHYFSECVMLSILVFGQQAF